MATKIKLQVNHGKHSKQQSGQKITIPADKTIQQTKPKQQPKKQLKPNITKQQQKSPKTNKNQQIKKQQSTNNKIKPNDKSPKQNQKQKKSPKKAAQKQKKQDKQLQTIQRIKNTQKKTKVTIEQLINQYHDAADDIFINHGHNSEKQKAIQQKLQKLQKQKDQRKKKLQEYHEKQISKSLKNQQIQTEKQLKKQQKQKQKRQKKAQRKLQDLKSLSSSRLKRQQKYKQYYNNQYKNKVFRFKKFQEQYKQKQKQYEQQIKQKLQKNKQKYLPMDQDQLVQFFDQYQHNRWNMIQENQKKRQFNKEVLEKQNKEIYAKIWKGQCHRRVKQERQQKLRQKNQGKTKLEKTRQYGTIVKQQFKPKISEQKRNRSLNISSAINLYPQQTQTIDGKQYKKIARQKYANGVNQGLFIQNLRKSLDHHQKVKKGNQYLQYLKSLPKVVKDKSQTIEVKPQQNPQRIRKNAPETTFKPKILKNPYYNSSETDRTVSKSATIDKKRIKDPQLFHYYMADFHAKSKQMQLQQRAIKYGRYNGILQLQDKHNSLNKKLVQGISQKLNILSKM